MKKLLIYILALLLVSVEVSSQTLDDYLVVAAENNPGLKEIGRASCRERV